MIEQITIKEIPFNFVRRNDHSLLLLGSDYCDFDLTSYLINNLPENIVNISELCRTIEVLIERYNQ